jgi:hypothetical protein
MEKIFSPVGLVTSASNGFLWLKLTMVRRKRQTCGNVLHVLVRNAKTDDMAHVIERFVNQKVPLMVGCN